jgi:hypothetical protein
MKNKYPSATVSDGGSPAVPADCGVKAYTAEGDAINIPLKLLENAGIPPDNAISVLSSDGVLIIAAANCGHQRDLTDELGCFLEELGFDPETVETIEPAIPF